MKFKVNDKVRITSCLHGHGFTIGKVVTIVQINRTDYKANDGDTFWYIQDDEIKALDENMLIEKVANKLLKANNTVTTLEIKLALRKEYPQIKWNQDNISEGMNQLHESGKYTYTDNGTYRIYSLTNVEANTPNPQQQIKTQTTNMKKSTIAPKSSSQRISRTKALELIQSSNGRFFGVTFTKKDGSVRKMKCKIDKNTEPSNLGYLTVNDVIDSSPKSLNLQTLSEVRMNKTFFHVK